MRTTKRVCILTTAIFLIASAGYAIWKTASNADKPYIVPPQAVKEMREDIAKFQSALAGEGSEEQIKEKFQQFSTWMYWHQRHWRQPGLSRKFWSSNLPVLTSKNRSPGCEVV